MLRKIGLPPGDIPLALLSFNIGVELGQLFVIGLVLTVGYFVRHMVPALVQHGPHVSRAAKYLTGSIAAF